MPNKFENMKPTESPAQYSEVEAIFYKYTHAIFFNQIDAASGMKKAKQEIDAVLRKK
jgi:hypothetical protein